MLTRVYNARGYLSQLKDGSTVIETINDLDEFGNSINESYANGVNTLRIYDPETGRLTDVNTTKVSTVIQDDDYAWRSNGTLESRIANSATGLNSTRKEVYTYDALNRVTKAETYINNSNTRDLDYAYNEFGNVSSKTSTLSGDVDVTGYGYGAGAAGPHAVTGATVAGVSHTLTYDSNGAVTKYGIAGSTDKYIAYNASNQPTKIVVGSGLSDPAPVAKDEFAYGPNGQRYARKTTWQDGANTYTEEAAYIGPVEVITDDSSGSTETITKTRLSSNVMHVKIVGTTTEEFFEYAHRDHLGSLEAVTDDNGNVLDQVAFEPFGYRKKKDWTANISASERDALLDSRSGHTRKARGFTGHEHLDRTGFIHMNGRVYDPVLGRFLSPDPIVQSPGFSQSWNAYSYVDNLPTSFTDRSGFNTDLPPINPTNPYPGTNFLGVGWWQEWGTGQVYATWADQNSVLSTPDISGNAGQANPYAREIGQSIEPIPQFTYGENQLGVRQVGFDPWIFNELHDRITPAPTDPVVDPAHMDVLQMLATIATEVANDYDALCNGGAICSIPLIRGSRIHAGFAKRIMSIGRPDIIGAEDSYRNGVPVGYALLGSVRVDARVGPLAKPIFVVELKTGASTISKRQSDNYVTHLPEGTPIYIIHLIPN